MQSHLISTRDRDTVPYDWNFVTVPQTGAANRKMHYARGKGIGGTSQRNFSKNPGADLCRHDWWVWSDLSASHIGLFRLLDQCHQWHWRLARLELEWCLSGRFVHSDILIRLNVSVPISTLPRVLYSHLQITPCAEQPLLRNTSPCKHSTRIRNILTFWSPAAYPETDKTKAPLPVGFANFAFEYSTTLQRAFNELQYPNASDFSSGTLNGVQVCPTSYSMRRYSFLWFSMTRLLLITATVTVARHSTL